MARIDIDHIDIDHGWDDFVDNVESLDDGAAVTVGVHKRDAPRQEEGLNNAQLLAIHEFGITVDHPGGTPYVVTMDGPRFVPKGYPDPDGYTDPHQITIPPRPVLRGSMAENRAYLGKESGDALADYLDLQANLRMTLARIGKLAESFVKSWFGSTSRLLPNAPATVEKKGKNLPMVESGELARAIDYDIHIKEVNDVGRTAKKPSSFGGGTDTWTGLIEN